MSSKIEVKVTNSGVQFGGAWFSHERITGYTPEQLNSEDCHVIGREYIKWLSTAIPVVELPLIEHCKQCSGIVKTWPESKRDCLGKIEPVVKRQPVDAILIDDCVEYRHRDYGGGYFGTEIAQLYTAPPELAELQVQISEHHKGIAAYLEHIKQLQATNAKLKEEISAHWKLICDQRAEIEQLKGGQSEPVAWMVGKFVWTYKISAVNYAADREIIPLYTSHPAPVSIVLPERRIVHPSSPLYAEAEQWNACLDKIKELNK